MARQGRADAKKEDLGGPRSSCERRAAASAGEALPDAEGRGDQPRARGEDPRTWS